MRLDKAQMGNRIFGFIMNSCFVMALSQVSGWFCKHLTFCFGGADCAAVNDLARAHMVSARAGYGRC